VTVVRTALVNNLATLSSLLTVIGSAALILAINWRLTAVVVLVFPLATILARLYSYARCARRQRRCRTSWPTPALWLKKLSTVCEW
jgi:ABC-type multidrug transport system fused ATPase/permease subunit